MVEGSEVEEFVVEEFVVEEFIVEKFMAEKSGLKIGLEKSWLENMKFITN